MPEQQEARLDVEDRFAIVPQWLLDADVSDAAVRLYAVLLRFGQTSGARMPSRSTLALRMRKKSTDTTDRAMRELVELGAVVIRHRFDGGQRLTNKYLVRTSKPGRETESGGGRKNAATPNVAATRTVAASRADAGGGGRISAARVAANLRHNPKSFTHSEPPPPPTPTEPDSTRAVSWEGEADRLKADCGIGDWDSLVSECQALRRQLGQPVARWSAHCLLSAIQLAVRARGWSPTRAPAALRAVAADPATRSPMRLAEAGPWWDETPVPVGKSEGTGGELAAMEADLADAGGLRVTLQRGAREQLAAEGRPVTRTTVTCRAHELLRERRIQDVEASAC